MKVYYYKTASGRSPVTDYIDSLAESDQARFFEVTEEIELHGLEAARVIFKPLQGKLWEIKFTAGVGLKTIERGNVMNKNHIAPMRDHAQKKLKRSATLRLLFEEERAKTEIARMIRAAREKAGLSQRELAQKAGTTQAVVARLEIGSDQRMPGLGLIARLLNAAGGKLEIVCRFEKVA